MEIMERQDYDLVGMVSMIDDEGEEKYLWRGSCNIRVSMPEKNSMTDVSSDPVRRDFATITNSTSPLLDSNSSDYSLTRSSLCHHRNRYLARKQNPSRNAERSLGVTSMPNFVTATRLLLSIVLFSMITSGGLADFLRRTIRLCCVNYARWLFSSQVQANYGPWTHS